MEKKVHKRNSPFKKIKVKLLQAIRIRMVFIRTEISVNVCTRNVTLPVAINNRDKILELCGPSFASVSRRYHEILKSARVVWCKLARSQDRIFYFGTITDAGSKRFGQTLQLTGD